jgi:hypothetical protein
VVVFIAQYSSTIVLLNFKSYKAMLNNDSFLFALHFMFYISCLFNRFCMNIIDEYFNLSAWACYTLNFSCFLVPIGCVLSFIGNICFNLNLASKVIELAPKCVSALEIRKSGKLAYISAMGRHQNILKW